MITGGGTGGHLFPAVAVGKEFLRAGKGNELIFVGTKRGIEKSILSQEGFELKYIDVNPIAGGGIVRKLKSIFTLPVALYQAFSLLKEYKPDFVLGVGGYASGPVVLSAKMMGIKTGIQEQNIFPGLTNKVLGRFADFIFLAFKEAGSSFKSDKVFITGNPVRKELFDSNLKEAYRAFMLDEDKFTIFVFGGSRGARSINEAFIGNLNKLDLIKEKIQIIHQSGDTGYDFVKRGYENSNIKAFVAPFIYNMNDAYNVADIVVCRAGATTISELAALGKAAILIPYPFAAGGHQKKNAEALVKQGAAVMIEDGSLDNELMETLIRLYKDEGRLEKLRENIKKLRKVDAAEEIVKIIQGTRYVSQG